MRNDLVTISLRLERPLWAKLRSAAEREPDRNGRASIRNIILQALADRFPTEGRATEATAPATMDLPEAASETPAEK